MICSSKKTEGYDVGHGEIYRGAVPLLYQYDRATNTEQHAFEWKWIGLNVMDKHLGLAHDSKCFPDLIQRNAEVGADLYLFTH